MSVLRTLGLISGGDGGGGKKKNTALMLLVAGVALYCYWLWVAPQGVPQPDERTGTDSASSAVVSTPSAELGDPPAPAASEQAPAPTGMLSVTVADLPPEAATTLDLIDEGGPFPYPDKDGSTFGNYEGLLPPQQRGYYREYTVPTPGARDRGARRIITGSAGEFYWTDDHYETFWRIER